MNHYSEFEKFRGFNRKLFIKNHGLLVESHQAYLIKPVCHEEVDGANGVHEGHAS
jgi:hypothetical protein